MSPKSFAVFSICFAICLCLLNSRAFGVQAPAQEPNANPGLTPNPVPNNVDRFVAATPVMPFVDPNSGQAYQRYVTTETVQDVAYSYQWVKDRVHRPRQVTENRTVTEVKYTPIQSYQWQLQNIPGWNPFASPQQVWQYVPIVQFQPNYETVSRPVTFVKYVEEEVPVRIAVLESVQKKAEKFADRPLGPTPNGGNTIAATPTNNTGVPNFNNQNIIQNAAQIAEANRNTPRYATRPIDYPVNYNYAGFPYRNMVPQAPYYPNPAIAAGTTNPASGPNPANPMLASAGALTPPPSNISPATPLRPNMLPVPNTMASNNGYPAGAYSSAAHNPYYASTPYQANPYQPNPYVSTASRPFLNLPSFARGTGSLFEKGLFTNNRNASYVASNTQVSQPYLWGNSTSNGPTFRPVSNMYTTPQPSWGVSPGNSSRDPMQGGMPATVLR